jgi:hypothetical protein
MRHRDDSQVELSTAEAMTIPLVASAFFAPISTNLPVPQRVRLHEEDDRQEPSQPSAACHLHAIEPHLWRMMFALLAELFKKRCSLQQTYYAVDSPSVAVCDDIRIRRCCRLYPFSACSGGLLRRATCIGSEGGSITVQTAIDAIEEGHDDGGAPKKKSFRCYIPSKRRYFYGLRIHLVVTGAGEPVEFSLAAGSESEVTIFKELELDLPRGSIIYAEKSYTAYDYEDLL